MIWGVHHAFPSSVLARSPVRFAQLKAPVDETITHAGKLAVPCRLLNFRAGAKAGGCRSDHAEVPENLFKLWKDAVGTRVLWLRPDPVPGPASGSSVPPFHVCNPAGLDGSSVTLPVEQLGHLIDHGITRDRADKRIGKAASSCSMWRLLRPVAGALRPSRRARGGDGGQNFDIKRGTARER